MTTRKILIATPTKDGFVHSQHMRGVIHAVSTGAQLMDCHMWAGDMVRMRNRCIRVAIESDATHLLFWDDDVSMSECLYWELTESPFPFSAALYMDARAKYPYHGFIKDAQGEWSKVERVPAGAMLLDIFMLRDVMPELPYYADVLPDGRRVDTPNFCENRLDKDNTRLSEDYSLCDTLREHGFYPHIYTRETACHWKTVPLHQSA